MFKGYIPTKNKKPIESVRGRKDFYSLADVRNLNEYGGVLDDPYIMVDVDEAEEADILYSIVKDLKLRCNVIQTSRGKHFYFLNTDVQRNSIHKHTAIGITVDIKLGSRNTVVPLKKDGVVRDWLQNYDELDSLPRWLQALDYEVNFTELESGDGRNQKLFNYILTLQSQGFTKDEIRETIRVINNHVLKEPLEQDEIETILRDEAFAKPTFFIKGRLAHETFATFLKVEHHAIKINGTVHIYDNGVYVTGASEIEKIMIKYIPGLTKSKRAEVLSYLELITEDKHLSKSSHIVCSNGLLDIETLKVEEFNPNYISKNKIPISYNPIAYSEVTDHTLEKICCHDKELRLLVEEMIGYCLLRRNELGKAFILTGMGSNGKSTLLEVIKSLLGCDNVSSIGLDELNERFKTAELFGKLANIGDDISNNYIQDNSTFKKLVTGETVNVERKGRDPFDFTNYSKLIFSANEIPRINDTSNGLMRRLVIVPFNAKFKKTDSDFDPFIKDKLLSQTSLEYILNIAIAGLKRVLKNRGFTEVAAVTVELEEYQRVNNPMLTFLEEHKIEDECNTDVYRKYSNWCSMNRLKPLSNIQFGREITKYGYKTRTTKVDGKTIRMFYKAEE